MPATARDHRLARLTDVAATLLPMVVAVLPFAVVAGVTLTTIGQRDWKGADAAILQMDTRRALELHQLLGPYSRFGWRHPGPALFYWYAPFFALSGQRLGGLQLAAAAANLTGAATVVWVTARAAGRRGAWAAAFALALLFVGLGPRSVANEWNPYLTVLPVAVAVVAAAATATGDTWALPVFAAAATFAVQTHLGVGPVVATLAVLAAGGLAWSRRQNRGAGDAVTGDAGNGAGADGATGARVGAISDAPSGGGALIRPPSGARRPLRGPIAVTAGLLLVLWFPVVYQQLTGEPGNLRSIVAHFVKGDLPTQPWGTIDGQVVAVTSLTTPGLGEMADTAGWATPLPAPDALDVVALAALLAVAVAVVVRVRDPARRFERALAAAALLAFAGSVLALKQITGEFVLYVVVFAMAAGMALWLTAALAAWSLWTSRTAGTLAGRWVPRASVAAVTVATVAVAAGARTDHETPPDATQSPAMALSDAAVDEAHRLHADTVSVTHVRNRDWPIATALVNGLEDDGVEPSVSTGFRHVFTRDYIVTGDEDVHLVLAPPGAAGPPPTLPRGAELVAQSGGLALYVSDRPVKPSGD